MATETTKITYVEGAAASTPAGSRVVVYAKADGLMYSKDDAGAETLMSSGAGPGSNPQFTTIELGHASDTTLARVSAGVVSIEGTNIVKAGAVTSDGITMATARLLGRTSASTGAVEEITVGTNLTLSGGTLDASGGSGASVTKVGTTSAGGSSDNVSAQFLVLKKITLASAGTILSIAANIGGDGSGHFGAFAGVVYEDNAGAPNKIIGGTSAPLFWILGTTKRWVTFPVGVNVASGDYWIGVYIAGNGADTSGRISYTGSGSDIKNTTGGSYVYDAPTSGGTSNDYSIYANVLA